MGDYNPHRPYILGNEWVPIKEQPYRLSLDRETGYEFTLPTASTVASGAYYVKPENFSVSLAHFIQFAVYSDFEESGISGPVQQVIVPPNGGASTGSVNLSDPGTIQDMLRYPNDGKYVEVVASTNSFANFVDVNFAMNSAPLSGKRILNLEVLYLLEVGGITFGFTFDDVVNAGSTLVGVALKPSVGGTFNNRAPLVFGSGDQPIRSTAFGELDVMHNVILNGDLFIRYPWIYPNLQLFEPTTPTSSRASASFSNIVLPFGNAITDADLRIFYAALRITYCEEKRLLAGARNNPGTTEATLIPLRSMSNLPAGPTVLPPGRYFVSVGEPRIEDNVVTATDIDVVQVNSLRQLYELPSIRGAHINKTFTIGHEFERIDTDQLVQIALLTSTGVVTGSHAYGAMVNAPQHISTPILQQGIDHTGLPATPTSYPQVRFYVRNFGDPQLEMEFRLFGSSTIRVRLTPEQFDALPELVDGWKEVTLRFGSPTPTFAGPTGSSTWVWDNSDAPVNQWQVLGADAPSVTGIPNLDAATYGGAANNLLWLGTTDTSADAVLIFSQDPPAPTGLAVSTQTQAVTGISAECGATRCIPTGIRYNRVTWNSLSSPIILDTFSRTVVSGWGVATTGQTWSHFSVGGVISPTDESVNGTKGVISVPATIAARASYLATVQVRDVDIRATVSLPTADVLGGALEPGGIMGRLTTIGDYYLFRFAYTTSEDIVAQVYDPNDVLLREVTVYYASQWTPGEDLNMRAVLDGPRLQFKIWRAAVAEPSAWNVDVIDYTYVGPGSIGVRSGVAAGNTNTNPRVFQYDNFSATPLPANFDRYELQRYDALENEWQTIMLTASPTVTGFNDYEARVGVESRYRIRSWNELNFAGLWSSEVANTLTAPGITGADDGNGVIIFTSNECQTGGANLAYVMAWDGTPEESFTFPEAGEVSFQRMYQRDFVTAFHPTERGGEQFTRNILVQAAAISPPSLANFRSLRDLMWAGLPYVAVRDELGNRWFANVRVPEGNVKRNRTLYIARVDITEVTAVPSPVDPGSSTCP